ncbi:hypothetical protein OS493_030710 [Desmophyllum pertusum]|uniref:Uncharacterized protein n=1 Tax=Desmophyllum pertusum TaxID=174260 RepID=A0A9X0CVH1_9CNID|nr:hypothetical protein OS493_030710 [Desmophyllum pertusum]
MGGEGGGQTGGSHEPHPIIRHFRNEKQSGVDRKSTAKVDYLKDVRHRSRKDGLTTKPLKWTLFQKEKYFCTFPYPYMNGTTSPWTHLYTFKEKEEKEEAKQMKSKIAAKTGGLEYQWQIMQSIGLTDEEIKKWTGDGRLSPRMSILIMTHL